MAPTLFSAHASPVTSYDICGVVLTYQQTGPTGGLSDPPSAFHSGFAEPASFGAHPFVVFPSKRSRQPALTSAGDSVLGFCAHDSPAVNPNHTARPMERHFMMPVSFVGKASVHYFVAGPSL